MEIIVLSIIVSAVLISIIILLMVARYIHTSDKKRWLNYNKYIDNDYIDDTLMKTIFLNSSKSFDYVYNSYSMPLGRVSSFLNYFQTSVYDEEPYVFYCKRSSRDNEFREYGCVLARTGVYISAENPQNSTVDEKSNQVLPGKDSQIDFTGLTRVFSIGSHLITVNHVPNKAFDKYKTISIRDEMLLNQVRALCNIVILNDIGIAFQKNRIADIIDKHTTSDNAFLDEYDEIFDNDDPLDRTERKLDDEKYRAGINIAGFEAVSPQMNAQYDEVKNYMNGHQGHGYAAEYANNTIDRALGRRVDYSAQNLDAHGRQVKNGPDRTVNYVEIQTKYYQTAQDTINAVFEKGEAKYIRTDGSGKMMQIEVPRNQYHQAVIEMQKRIDNGEVPNVSPGENARNYVRKGFFTYEQSYNIARAGTLDSLTVDALTGAVCCIGAAGVTSAIVFALAIWRGESPKDAARDCLSSSLTVIGKGALIYTLTMQLSRKEVAMVLAGKNITENGISQGYKAIANPIYNASENLATQIAQSNIAKSQMGKKLGLEAVNGRQIIGGAVTIAVVFGPDIVKTMQGKISTKQLFKNSTVAASALAAGAAAQAAIPIPVVPGLVAGAAAAIATKKALDYFIEDDAKEMFRILKEEFIDTTMLAYLTSDELDEVSRLTVGNKKISKMLEKMFQANDRREYARNTIMQEAILTVTKERKKVYKKDYENGLIDLIVKPAL